MSIKWFNMQTYKRLSRFFLSFLSLFILYNLVIWNCFTADLMTNQRSEGGDLARLGYIHGVKCFRKNSCDLPRRHVEQEDYKGERIDLITIGDSFTNGGGGGKNRYYQDYIASINNISVMNIEPFKDMDLITLTSVYVNNGYLDTIRPRYLLLSSAEKYCASKFSSKLDFDKYISMEGFSSLKRFGYRRNSDDIGEREKDNGFGFINEGNFKFPLYTLYYYFSDRAFFSKTYKMTLNVPLFSVKESTTLLFYRDDVKNLGRSSQGAIEQMNENLNRLADKLARKGIKLYFMPCVDKYNLYSEFIVDNRVPPQHLFRTAQTVTQEIYPY